MGLPLGKRKGKGINFFEKRYKFPLPDNPGYFFKYIYIGV